MINLSPLTSADLGRNVMVFVLGFVIILVGIYVAKKMQVLNGPVISKNDRKLFEKAKRALGFSSESNTAARRN